MKNEKNPAQRHQKAAHHTHKQKHPAFNKATPEVIVLQGFT